ncbi:hypothetical protein BC628DRAFT_1416306 [Trametes gibbosa]|nr:hypothetical protein BC628DRAFT_1416306 [Trametes gibbosa]
MSTQLIVSVDDTSPLFNYIPHGDGGVGSWTQTGWQPWFSDSGGFNSAGGNDGVGASYHVTAFSGARLDLQFYGTGITLFGNGTCPYEVSLDGASQSFSSGDGQLFSQEGLQQKLHSISLTANASASNTFWFDRADIASSVIGSSRASIVYPATNTTFMQYDGGWKVQNDPNGQIPSKANPAPYYEVDNPPASVSFSFEGTGVAVNGSRNWGSGVYDVSLDGNVDTYNASTMWLIGDTLLFYQEGLDPSITHTVNITPKVGDGVKFWLNSVTVLADENTTAIGVNGSNTVSPSATSQMPEPTSGSFSSAPKKVNVGVVLGPIIGGIALLVIIAALAVCYRRRRRVAGAASRGSQYASYVLPPSPTPLMQETSAETVVSPLPPPYKLTREINLPYATARAAVSSGSSSFVSPPGSAQPWAPSAQSPVSLRGTDTVPSGGNSSVSSGAPSASTPPAAAAAAADSHAAVDRLIQIIADRIGGTHPRPAGFEYGPDVPPPEYGA